MEGSRRPRHAQTVLALCACALASACTTSEEATLDVGPTGDPTLSIAEPGTDGFPVCVSIGTDADFRLPVLVDVEELALRPPGACGSYAQCGQLALYVDGVLNDRSAVPVIEVLFRRLGDRYHDGATHVGTGEPDVLHVRVDAVGDDMTQLLDHAGEPLSDSIELVTVPTCPAP